MHNFFSITPLGKIYFLTESLNAVAGCTDNIRAGGDNVAFDS